MMGDLSKNFSRSEFACKCGCGLDTVDAGLVKALEEIREYFDRPIKITSGSRCQSNNRQAGGKANSQHLICKAADIVVKDTPAELVRELAEDLGVKGIGGYVTFTHIDVRNTKARW